MAGARDRALAGVIARLEGSVWPDVVEAAIATLRRVAHLDQSGEHGLVAHLLTALDAGAITYDVTDPSRVDFADALVEYAASLEAHLAAHPSFVSGPIRDPREWAS